MNLFDRNTTLAEPPEDPAVTAALQALNHVQTPGRLAHRVHARLAQQPIAAAERASVAGWLPWAALGSLAAGLAAALIIHPYGMHSPTTTAPVGLPAPTAAAPVVAPAQPVHPPFVAAQRQGRGALNTNGTVATARAQSQHRIEEAEARKPGAKRKSALREAKNATPAAPLPAQP